MDNDTLPPDTLPPGIGERPSLEPLLTERRFVEIMQTLVGTPLAEIKAELSKISLRQDEQDQKIMRLAMRQEDLEKRVADLERTRAATPA